MDMMYCCEYLPLTRFFLTCRNVVCSCSGFGHCSGSEKARRYVITDDFGNHPGYIAEQERDIGKSDVIPRRWFRTRRGFVAHVFDRDRNDMPSFEAKAYSMEMDTKCCLLVLPPSWVNSCIWVYDPLGLTDAAHSPEITLILPPSSVNATYEGVTPWIR
jgi:Scramblase